jgi:hypothetical protein
MNTHAHSVGFCGYEINRILLRHLATEWAGSKLPKADGFGLSLGDSGSTIAAGHFASITRIKAEYMCLHQDLEIPADDSVLSKSRDGFGNGMKSLLRAITVIRIGFQYKKILARVHHELPKDDQRVLSAPQRMKALP